MRKNKYIFFKPNVIGGVKTYIEAYSKYLQMYGNEVLIVNYDLNPHYIYDTVEYGLTNDKVKVVTVGLSAYSASPHKYKTLLQFISIEDIAICNDSFELEALNYQKKKNKIIYILHGDLGHYKNIIKKWHKIIDGFFCVSIGLKNKYDSVELGINFNMSYPIVDVIEKSITLSNDKLKCIFIGRFEYLKGADIFLSLVNKFKQKSSIEWIIVTTSRGSEQELLKKIPSEVDIFFDLPNAKVKEILAQCDVLIFPSRSEGFGIVVLEASVSGMIAIVSNLPIGIPDQIVDNYNGFIIEDATWDSAYNKLEEINLDRKRLNEMKFNAIEYAKKKFDPDWIVSSFIETINSIKIQNKKKFVNQQTKWTDVLLPRLLYGYIKFLYVKTILKWFHR